MLPQTNLQLYRVLIERGWSDRDLAGVRSAYELATRLFSLRYRPDGRAFVCHLVGAAGAVARWDERPAMVGAALLHAAYEQGGFGDGERDQAAPRRRNGVAALVGEETEQLIHEYFLTSKAKPRRDIAVLRLADRLDELSDGGPAYAPLKGNSGEFDRTEAAADSLVAEADRLVGPGAAADFRTALALLAATRPPDCLTSDRRASHALRPGVAGLRRSPAWARAVRFAQKLPLPKAA